MADLEDAKQELIDFMYVGLDHGVNSIADNGGPLIPFVLTQVGDKKDLKRFITERIEQGQIEGESYLKSLRPSPDMALIVFDGFITVEGKKLDSIIIRSFDKSAEEGLIFAQPYIQKQNIVGIETFGNARLLGKEENIIKDAENFKDTPKRPWWKFKQ